MAQFPSSRLRRNRKSPAIRNLLAEVKLSVDDLILPIFICEAADEGPILAMPNVARYTIENAIKQVQLAHSLGINAIAPFPVTSSKLKTPQGEESYNPNNLICRFIKQAKSQVPEIAIFADVALDPYTTHGHDGILDSSNQIDNDASVYILCKQALMLAKAGADVVAPSDMMDGRTAAIRKLLDKEGHTNTSIMAYSAKYASSYYGPFRDAIGSSKNLQTASKETYQMDFRNIKEANQELEQDIAEGADILMIKPALPYLDIIKTASTNYNTPIFAYQVSGEYSSIVAAANNGFLDLNKAMLESLTSIKRAGARAIFTYAAIEVAKLLEK